FRRRSVANGGGTGVVHQGPQPLAQRAKAWRLDGTFLRGKPQRLGKAHGSGDVLGAAAHAVLLPSPAGLRVEGGSFLYIQGPDAAGTTALVGGERDQGGAERGDIDGDAPRHLGRVDVQEGTCVAGERTQLRRWHHDTR